MLQYLTRRDLPAVARSERVGQVTAGAAALAAWIR